MTGIGVWTGRAGPCCCFVMSRLRGWSMSRIVRSAVNACSLAEAALSEWDGLFRYPSLGRDARFNSEYHRPLDLIRQRLVPAADIIPFDAIRH